MKTFFDSHEKPTLLTKESFVAIKFSEIEISELQLRTERKIFFRLILLVSHCWTCSVRKNCWQQAKKCEWKLAFRLRILVPTHSRGLLLDSGQKNKKSIDCEEARDNARNLDFHCRKAKNELTKVKFEVQKDIFVCKLLSAFLIPCSSLLCNKPLQLACLPDEIGIPSVPQQIVNLFTAWPS